MSNLPENMSASADPKATSLEQSQEDQATVKMVMHKFQKFKKYRSRYDRNWLHYYKMFRGDQWDGIKMPRFRQKEIVNMVFESIQSSVPLQTDVRPQIQFIPEEPSDLPFSEVINEISNSDWERNNWLYPLTEVLYDAYFYGLGIGYFGYEPSADFGLGRASFKSEDPFYCYPDPDCNQINDEDSRGFIVAKPVDTDKLKSKYPEFKNLIKPDITDAIQSSKASINDFKFRTHNVSDRDMPDLSFIDGQNKAEGKTLEITAYLLPDEMEEIHEPDGTDELTGDPKFKTLFKKKYPNGRTLTVVCGLLVKDEPSLPFAHGEIPYGKLVNYILPREFYGISEVEQLESPQRTFNKILNAQLEIMSLMGNPVWVVSTDSGVEPEQLVNRTGLVVQKEPNSDVQRLDGIQLSAAAMQLADRMEKWFNNVAGTQDVSRGEAPGSVTAASAIDALQQAARTRIRQKQRNLDAFLRDFGRQYVSIVLEKYSKSRVFRVTNNEGSTKYFRMSVEKLGDGKSKAIVQHYSEDGQTLESPKEYLIAGRFDVRVNSGSGLPFTKSENEQKTLQLFDRQIIDAEEVLKNLEYPNYEAVLSRVRARQAEMAAQQQQAEQGAA